MMIHEFISNLHREESGQDLVEYALVLIAVAAGVLFGSATLQTDFATWMTTVGGTINADL